MLRAAVALCVLEGVAAWWSKGTLPTDREFAVYIGKFCFDYWHGPVDNTSVPPGIFNATVVGEVNASVDTPSEGLYLMVFSDEQDHWMRARPFWEELSCKERMELASWVGEVSSYLTEAPFRSNDNVSVKQTVRPRFWYFAYVNCGARIVMPLEFQVHATNPLQGYQAEFSMDLRGSVFLEASFFGLFALVALASCWGLARAAEPRASPRASPLLRLLCASAVCSTAGSALRAMHHAVFAANGEGVVLLAVLGALLACVAKALLTMLQFIVAKGWAVLYGHGDWHKRFTVLAALGTVVGMSVGCEIWEQYFHDQSTAFYHYESWPGRLILGLNACLLVASLALMRATYRRETVPEVRTFYLLVTLACGVYFTAIPVVCLLAELLDPWVRRKYVERTEISTRFAATVFLLLCLRPSRLDRIVAARLKNGDQPELLAAEKRFEEEELS